MHYAWNEPVKFWSFMIIGSPQMKMILQYKHLVSMVIDQEVLLFLIGSVWNV